MRREHFIRAMSKSAMGAGPAQISAGPVQSLATNEHTPEPSRTSIDRQDRMDTMGSGQMINDSHSAAKPDGGRTLPHWALSAGGEARNKEGQQGFVRRHFARTQLAMGQARGTVRRNFSTRSYDTGELLLKTGSSDALVAEYPWLRQT